MKKGFTNSQKSYTNILSQNFLPHLNNNSKNIKRKFITFLPKSVHILNQRNPHPLMFLQDFQQT